MTGAVRAGPKTLPAFAEMLSDPREGPLTAMPDNTTHATNILRLRDVTTVSTNGNGDAAVIVCPSTYGGTSTATVVAGAVTAWGALDDSSYHAAIVSGNSFYRTLAYSVEWMCTQTSTNAAGRAILTGFIDATYANLGTVNLASLFDDEGAVGPESESLHANMRPYTQPVFTTQANEHSTFMPYCVLVVTNATATAQIGQLVVTRIVEVVPRNFDISRGTARYTACDTMACCIASNVQGPKVTYAAGKDGYQRLKKTAVTIAKAAMAALAGNGVGTVATLSELLN